MVERFQPPTRIADARTQQALSDVSKSLDSAPRLSFAPISASAVSVAPGEIKRLNPRSGGMTAVLQTASASNAGMSCALFVSGPGALTVAPASGTINGASQLVFAAGTYSLELVSDGSTWLTQGLATGSVTGAMIGAFTGDVTKPSGSAVLTIANDAVTNAKAANMAARTVKLRADGAGTGDPTDGTGAQLGEILRLSAVQTDTTATGTIVTYALAEATNVVRFTAIAATTIRGATIPAETGQIVVWENNDASGATVTFNNEDGSAAAAGERFRCPGGAAFLLVQAHRMITVYINQRWRIVGTA